MSQSGPRRCHTGSSNWLSIMRNQEYFWLDLLARLKSKAEQRIAAPVKVVTIHEVGLDGFWIHRLLEANGVESHVVDPASIAVPRRHRRAKTDTIDGEALLRTLMAWQRGEPRVCAMTVPP